MQVYEITGYTTGIDRAGVNFLDPKDAFERLENGYIYRQELKSRLGFTQYGNRLGTNMGDTTDETRVMGIFENIIPDNSTTELLVCSQKFLYSFDSSTNTFTQIPFNSVDPITDFGISDPAAYVSGTTYLEADGSQRFVFTGFGMDDIYFYDGTDVKRFTNTTDNPNYQQPAAGTLTRATTVLWFGERLNLFSPVIAGSTNHQAVLYSGIRNTAGNGDKFNVAGAGLLEADTYEKMNGAIILGDIVVENFQRSSWSLEKTRDAFNPYFVRKIPSVLGADAPFSAVSWKNSVKSAGRTGMITTDGRQQLRFDNNVPYFTQDEIEAANFDLTYGGFDRNNGQFLFAYRNNGSNLSSTTQDKVLVYNYEESTFSINDQRFSCFGQTYAGLDLTWSEIDEDIKPSWARWDTTEEIWNKIGISAATQKTLAGDNLGFVYEINQGFNDYFVMISNITQASSAVITVDPSGFQIGDEVIFENVEGMTEINGLIGTVTAATTTSITVNIDSTNFTAYSASGTVSKVINFYAELSPFNPFREEGRKCYISYIEFLLNTNSGSVTVDVFEDEEESPFKTTLLQTTGILKEREWINMIVNQESNFLTFTLRNQSASTQTIISSIRIHCDRGGFTSG
jgi:hypothetical protein